MKAQVLYDLRDEVEFCSGMDLHEFFEAQVGEPSPAGNTEVNLIQASQFVREKMEEMKQNSPLAFAAVAQEMREVEAGEFGMVYLTHNWHCA